MVAVRALSPTAGPLAAEIADDDLVVVVPDGAALVADVVPEDPGDPPCDAVFGDLETDGERRLRPAWSPTRAVTDPASVLPLAVRARLVRAGTVDPWDPAIALTVDRAGLDVAHVPIVLTAHTAPPAAPGAARLDAHLRARGVPARVVPGERADTWRLQPDPGFRPRITVVIPTAGAPHPDGTGPAVHRCLDALARIARAGTADLDAVLVVGPEFDGDADALPARTSLPSVLVRRPDGPFDFADAVNRGILAATGDRVLLLNDDTEVVDTQALVRMAVHLEDPTVGAVGAQLRYPDGTIQHAGVVLDDARALHPFVGADPSVLGRHGADVARDVVAVTGACLLARRSDLLAVGGLSTDFPLSFNDVDLCIRLRRHGLRVVVEPAAVVIHHETLTRSPVIATGEWDRWIARWGEIDDPWYHPAHHRPDDPGDLRRNADHLPPLETDPPVPTRLRTGRLRSRVHRGRPAATAGVTSQ